MDHKVWSELVHIGNKLCEAKEIKRVSHFYLGEGDVGLVITTEKGSFIWRTFLNDLGRPSLMVTFDPDDRVGDWENIEAKDHLQYTVIPNNACMQVLSAEEREELGLSPDAPPVRCQRKVREGMTTCDKYAPKGDNLPEQAT